MSKKSLILPLVLIIAPASVFGLAIISNYTTGLEATSTTGDAYVDYMNSRSEENLPFFQQLASKPLSSLANVSAIAVIPCFILGMVMLLKRKVTVNKIKHTSSPHTPPKR